MPHIRELIRPQQVERMISGRSYADNSMSTTEQEANPALVQLLTVAFEKWKKNFGNKMPENDWDLTKAQLWAVALADIGMTPRLFKIADRLVLSQDWPPSCAKEFADLVKGHHPDMRQAYLDACNERYPHQVIYETAKRVGFYELRTKAESESYPMWQKHYLDVCHEYDMGADFRLPQSRQIEEKHIPASKEFSDKIMEQIFENLGKRHKRKPKQD